MEKYECPPDGGMNLRIKSERINNSGTTLIEALTVLFIFSLITTSFYSAWTAGTNYIFYAKSELMAMALANEKLEIVRNLAFDDIAHTTGDPVGNLLQDEDIIRNGRSFHVFTQIKNQDDSLDGACLNTGDPDCLAPVDYKDVKITVSWDGGAHKIESSSRFVPSGMEQPDPTRGVLVVNALSDKNAMAPVSGSNINIKRIDTSFEDNQSTDTSGRSVVSGLKEAIGKYQITLSKSGYETVSTSLSFADGGLYNPPANEHASVVALAVNTIVLYQNKLSDFSIKTQDYIGNEVAGINYHISGGRVLGKSSDGTLDIYSLDSHDDTDSSGEKTYNDTNPGTFKWEIEEPGYRVIRTSRALPFSISPDESVEINIKVASESATGILFKIDDSGDGSSVAGASVHLTSSGGFDATVTADDNGLAFFPKEETAPLTPGDIYDFTVDASGFIQQTGQVTAVVNSLEEETILLVSS